MLFYVDDTYSDIIDIDVWERHLRTSYSRDITLDISTQDISHEVKIKVDKLSLSVIGCLIYLITRDRVIIII